MFFSEDVVDTGKKLMASGSTGAAGKAIGEASEARQITFA